MIIEDPFLHECAKCRWYRESSRLSQDGHERGYCFINPPTVVGDGEGCTDQSHPVVLPYWSCRLWNRGVRYEDE